MGRMGVCRRLLYWLLDKCDLFSNRQAQQQGVPGRDQEQMTWEALASVRRRGLKIGLSKVNELNLMSFQTVWLLFGWALV